jgi:hypothetical protein
MRWAKVPTEAEIDFPFLEFWASLEFLHYGAAAESELGLLFLGTGSLLLSQHPSCKTRPPHEIGTKFDKGRIRNLLTMSLCITSFRK